MGSCACIVLADVVLDCSEFQGNSTIWLNASESAKEASAIHRNFLGLLHGPSSHLTRATLTKKKKKRQEARFKVRIPNTASSRRLKGIPVLSMTCQLPP